MTRRIILFPTDFGGRCDRARDRAVHLAERWNALLVLLHVREVPADAPVDQEADEALRAKRLRAEVGDPAIDVDIRLATGDVAEAIVATAAEVRADLIVTGLSHRDELGDFLLGATVERVVRHAASPILVVKAQLRGGYAEIMVATDFSDCAAKALETAAELFTETRITLLHAYHVSLEAIRGRDAPAAVRQAEIASELDAFLQRVNLPAEVRERLEINVDYGDVCRVAADHVGSSGTDLAVIGTHGRSIVIGSLLGSTARRLLGSLECDVLLVRNDRRLPRPSADGIAEGQVSS